MWLRKKIQTMSRQNKLINVVVGIVFNPSGDILIAKRPSHKPHSGLWEFPGGKIESEESPFQALKRELFEEVGINITDAKPLIKFKHKYPDRVVDLDTYIVKEFSGDAFSKENQTIRWVKLSDLTNYEFPQGSNKIIESISFGVKDQSVFDI